MNNQKSYEASCAFLQNCGLLDNGEIPSLPSQMPSFDDEEPLGISFFKELLEDSDLENLTLPRTFVGRCELKNVSFKNTNLMESRLCWNDFIDVDFTQSNLDGCDLRASLFHNVKFIDARLEAADLRHSSFNQCDFTGAQMKGAILATTQASQLNLSSEQDNEIDWRSEEGEEPDGG